MGSQDTHAEDQPGIGRTDDSKFHLETEVEVDDREFRISTIKLRAALYGGMNFETCVFWDDGSRVITRYPNQEAAESKHERTVDAIRAGDYEIAEGEIPSFEITRDV